MHPLCSGGTDTIRTSSTLSKQNRKKQENTAHFLFLDILSFRFGQGFSLVLVLLKTLLYGRNRYLTIKNLRYYKKEMPQSVLCAR